MDTSDSLKGKIYGKMADILRDVGAIAKTQKNPQGWSFRGIDDVYNNLNPIMGKHGVFVTPRIKEKHTEKRPTKNQYGKEVLAFVVENHYVFTFYADDGSCVQSEALGMSIDYSDKGYSQAESAAYRDAMIKVFMIPIKKSPENDAQSNEIQGVKNENETPKQEEMKDEPPKTQDKDPIKEARDNCARMASQLLTELGRSVQAVKEGWLMQNFNKKPQDMTVKDWESCISMLQKELNQKKQ